MWWSYAVFDFRISWCYHDVCMIVLFSLYFCFIKYDSLLPECSWNCRTICMWFRLMMLCVGCHSTTTGHNFRDLPQLSPRGATADTFPTKAKFAPNISWALHAYSYMKILNNNYDGHSTSCFLLSSASLLLSNQLSHESVLIVLFLSPPPFPQRWHCPTHRNWQL